MADIFLSYSRVDRPRAQTVARSLEEEGFTVWWDKVLRAGQTYDEVTEGMLRDAAVVIVLWSETSVKSKWVRAEATLGQRTCVLIPAMIDEADRPIMFELTQSADLIGWDGDRQDKRWKDFVADIRMALESAKEAETPQPDLPANATPAIAHPDATIENTFWTSISDSDDPADYEAYLKRYPTGHFVDLARNRLSGLTRQEAEPQPAAQVTQAMSPAPKPARSADKAPRAAGMNLGLLIGLGAGAVAIAGLGAMLMTGQKPATQATETTAPVPTVFADCDTCPVMVRLDAGTFDMGSPESEVGRTGNEGPLHEVSVPAFAMSQNEITFDQWEACVEEGGCNGYAPPDRGFGKGSQPVIGISWYDGQAYVQWLSRKAGRPYRLPTEAEWEYAARGGTQTAYWWGEVFNASIAPTAEPVPPDTLPENPFGLKAMLGNAREWVEDCYVNNYDNAPTDGRAQQSGDCSRRVLKGGAWGRDPDDHRAANRARIVPDVRDKVFGLRVVTSDVSVK